MARNYYSTQEHRGRILEIMDPTDSEIPEVVFLPHKKEANFFKMKRSSLSGQIMQQEGRVCNQRLVMNHKASKNVYKNQKGGWE